MIVCEKEEVVYDDNGLEAVIFTAQGDMRQVTLSSIFIHGHLAILFNGCPKSYCCYRVVGGGSYSQWDLVSPGS